MIKNPIIYFLGAALLAFILSGCSSAMNDAPYAFGPVNKVIIVSDDDIWEGAIGDTMRYYMGAAYPVLPQPEPTLDLQHFNPKEIKADLYRKRFRTMLFLADASNPDSPTTRMVTEIVGQTNIDSMLRTPAKLRTQVAQNKWAANQVVFLMYGDGKKPLKMA